jgi:glycosyltransferase involved in cell wall biosynthesis
VNKKIIFVIPAYNEEKNLKEVILKFKKIGKVVVVNDSSEDRTRVIASKYSDYLINNKFNKGYDKSLRLGLSFAANKIIKSEIIFSIDGDNQHQPESVNRFLVKIKSNNIVIGKRQFYNRFSEYFVSFFSKKLDNISDPLCGMKCYKKEYLKSLLNNLKSKEDYIGMFFLKKKLKSSQVKINVKKNVLSNYGSGLKINLKIIITYIKIKFNLI